ncbi:MAG: preprotein translocase subunit SecG [Bacteroidales bacterium]|nr:preprotein translocase subunit SecG [Bacteroidales bacterium]MBN2757050.1 preprotein translocase subunit SecG [Bacteroidales bacterium]
MYTLISVLTIIASIFLILIVLVQNSKGGGLVSNFSSSNQIMGVRKTTDFLEKATWALAIAILSLSIIGSMAIPHNKDAAKESVIIEQVNNAAEIPIVPTVPGKSTNDKKENN